jgi:hypothetical protein
MVQNLNFEQLVAAAQQELQQFVISDGSVAFPMPGHIATTINTT